MKKLKILELTNFSAGGCGVFARVKREAVLLKKAGFEVKIFSSDIEKGTNRIVPKEDSFEGVNIKRFSATKLGGESFMNWDFEEEAIAYHPDIILAHVYRHLHTIKAISLAKKLKAKLFLITHAPFDRDKSRSFVSKFVVWLFDKFIGKRVLNKYDKVLTISHWEVPYLLEIGVNKSKIAYSPNGIGDIFFSKAKTKEQNKIIYTGRISQIKNLQTIIKSIPYIKDKNIKIELFGPAEPDYLLFLKNLVREEDKTRVIFKTKIYTQEEQIKELDSSKIFVLPSISEGMPQVLIEALARKKIVIASSNKGNADIIKDGENGFLFEIGNEKELAKKINYALLLPLRKIDDVRKNAENTAKAFNWKIIITKLIGLLHKA